MANEANLKPFKPGQSGNPDGKPPGIKNRATIARKWLELEMEDTNPLTGEIAKITLEDIITLRQIKKAKEEGDYNSYKAIMDSAYGAPKQELDATVSGQIILSVTNDDLKLGE